MLRHSIRPLLASMLVLGSVGTLADVAQAAEPRMIPFECTIPMTGTIRCGDPDRNIRLGPEKRLSIEWASTTGTNPETKVTFHVFHAVSGKELASEYLQKPPTAKRMWTNPNNKSVDVYVTAGSDTWGAITIRGWYYIDQP